MLYPALFAVGSQKQVCLFALDRRGAMGGPYTVLGWESRCNEIPPNKCLLGWVRFTDGTKTITFEEHHERLTNGEDATKGVYNLFSQADFFCKVDFADGLGELRVDIEEVSKEHIHRIWRRFVHLFPLGLRKCIQNNPERLFEIEQALGETIQGNELDFLKIHHSVHIYGHERE